MTAIPLLQGFFADRDFIKLCNGCCYKPLLLFAMGLGHTHSLLIYVVHDGSIQQKNGFVNIIKKCKYMENCVEMDSIHYSLD